MIAARRPRVVALPVCRSGRIHVDAVPLHADSGPGIARPCRLTSSSAEYRPCAVLVPANFGGNCVFMVRKDAPCPAGSARGPAPTNR